MSRFVNIISSILLVAVFSGSPVFSSDVEDGSDKIITGVLVRVDLKKQAIYIKENSRIVKFKASADLCEKFKSKINSEVDITYIIGDNKSLQIVTIVVAEKKDDSDKAIVRPKAMVNGKSKK